MPVSGGTVTSDTILECGMVYHIRAHGTFVIGGPGDGLADAAYADFTSPFSHCNYNPADVQLGIGINDSSIDNDRFPDWGAFDQEHVYNIDFMGEGKPISINYHDCYYGDNSGGLTVEIFGTSPPTHFIAIGDRGVGTSISPVFHYSLEYWQCGGDFSPLNHTDGFTPAEIVAKCKALNPTFQPKKLDEVELLARTGWEVWAGVNDFFGTGRSWLKQGVWIAEIMYTGTAATELMPIYTGNAADVQAKWATITGIATSYPWAEQSGFSTGNIFTQWPRSMYKSIQTNSNTFVRHLVATSGLTMIEMDGIHPGNDTPSQNTETDVSRPLTFYAANTPWTGSATKPEPSRPPP